MLRRKLYYIRKLIEFFSFSLSAVFLVFKNAVYLEFLYKSIR